MRILNDVELTLIRSEMYLSISQSGNITVDHVKAYRDFVLDIQEYCGKKSMIVRNILNAVTWNICNYSNDIAIVSKNYKDLLVMINDNIEQIDVDFFYTLFMVGCGKYNQAFTNMSTPQERIEMMEAVDKEEVPLDYLNEHIEMKNILLRCYLDAYQQYSYKVPATSTKIKELITIKNGIDKHQFELFN